MNETLLKAAQEAGFAEGRGDAGDDATWIASLWAGYMGNGYWGWIGAALSFALVFWMLHKYYYRHYESKRKEFYSMLDDCRPDNF